MSEAAKLLPLRDEHAKLGARFGVFAGWEVPIQYCGIMEEHQACREASAIFDVSHMGKIEVSGRKAASFLERMVPKRLDAIKPGRAFYTLLLNQSGGILDDLIVYQISAERFLLIVNAACAHKDFAWFAKSRGSGVMVKNQTEEAILLAVQGPSSEEILEKVFPGQGASLKPFHCTEVNFSKERVFIGATGYTGERGFELMAPNAVAHVLWERIMEAGKPRGLQPAGFGARDTLRLESCYLLYDQDMTEETNPLEAGLEWTLDFRNENFTGRASLLAAKQEGLRRRLVGFQTEGMAIPRHGQVLSRGGRSVGEVTSGTFAPTLKKNIGLGYVSVDCAAPGTELDLTIRDRSHKVAVVKTPFYRRERN